MENDRTSELLNRYNQSDLRLAALNEACRHRLASESADSVVKNAEKYFVFLSKQSSE